MDAHDDDQDSTRPRLARSLSFPDTPQIELAIAGSVADARKPRAIDPNVAAEASSVPPRPPRNPARSPHNRRSTSSKKRPSTATGTREEVTPWELFPPPDIGEPAVLLKPWPDYTVSRPPRVLVHAPHIVSESAECFPCAAAWSTRTEERSLYSISIPFFCKLHLETAKKFGE